MKKILIPGVLVIVIVILFVALKKNDTSINQIPADGNQSILITDTSFVCSNQSVISTQFYADDTVTLAINNGESMTLNQTISASGARYANADESFVFWNKGNTAFIEENGEATYNDCVQQESVDTGNTDAGDVQVSTEINLENSLTGSIVE